MPVIPATILALCAASLLLPVIFGLALILVIGQALSHGRRVALASVAGSARRFFGRADITRRTGRTGGALLAGAGLAAALAHRAR